MKKFVYLFSLIFIFILLTGCGTVENPLVARKVETPSDSGLAKQTEVYTFQAEVINTEVPLLVAPDKDSNEARSSDKISVSVQSEDITNANGDTITLEDLKKGDFVTINYNGVILESYPAQITADSIAVVGHNVLYDGYMALIDDIYQEDSGLNGEIEMIALDTTGWTGLTDIQKEMIFSQVKEAYGFDTVEGTYDDLVEQGLINEDQLYFEKGILIKLSNMTYDEDKQTITCAISKWRSGLGAVGSDEVTAQLKDGTWNITKESRWIS